MTIQNILIELFNSTDASSSHRLKTQLFESIEELYVTKNNGSSPTLNQLIVFTVMENLSSPMEPNRESTMATEGEEDQQVFIERIQLFLNYAVDYMHFPIYDLKIPLSLTYDALFDDDGCLNSFGASFENRVANVNRFNQSFLAYRLQEKFYGKRYKPKRSSKIKQDTREFVFLTRITCYYYMITWFSVCPCAL